MRGLSFDSFLSPDIAEEEDRSDGTRSVLSVLPSPQEVAPRASNREWVSRLYTFVFTGESRAGVRAIFDAIEDMISDHNYCEIDDVLATLDVEGLDTQAVVGLLSITKGVDRELENRKSFIKRAGRWLGEIEPEHAEGILRALR